MKRISILNHVLGPVMHGPSSSHTAAAHRIGLLVRSLVGEPLERVQVAFDPNGSYGQVYHEQGADLSFAAGLMGWSITDSRFARGLEEAAAAGITTEFEVRSLEDAPHPNTVRIEAHGREGRRVDLLACSTGGGAVEVNRLNGHVVLITGERWAFVVEGDRSAMPGMAALVTKHPDLSAFIESSIDDASLTILEYREDPGGEIRSEIASLPGIRGVARVEPLFFVAHGEALFESAREMVAFANSESLSLGTTALRYEAALLSLSPEEVLAEMGRRLDVMLASVQEGLRADAAPLQLLRPTAHRVMEADARKALALGGPHTRAAARALAAMHVNGAMGVVCAAPTAGSAGVLPAVAATLLEECSRSREDVLLGLLAAGAVGVIVAERATFAAEECGCQVEIGAAGAMAAALVVDVSSGSAAQACDAAAIALQNTMGSVCDLVRGAVEIPCHTRNAVAASSAFVCADLVMGGYDNPIPLDETIDASAAAGRMLPAELRCTARGGLAVTPSALAMERRRLRGG